tara:strand:+ start:1183 stop:3165 length:1983 start_codon:yes stop_codon:yes gene_type:complete
MISYFKYTSGESFTLSGRNYTGLFNVVDGRAFSGKSLTESSTPLSSKGTFIGDAFLAEKEFDRTVQVPRVNEIVTKPHISPKDVIDQSFINTNLGILNDNNLNLYALNVLSNPEIINFQSNSKDGDSYLIALSSLEESKSIRYGGPGESPPLSPDQSTVVLAKDNDSAINAMLFESILQRSDGAVVDVSEVPPQLDGIYYLDETISSTIVVNRDQTFNYFTTTPTASYAFSGSFLRDSIFSFREETTDAIPANSKLIYDNNTDTIYNLGKNAVTNKDRLIGYDFSFYNTCGEWKIKDIFEFDKEVIQGNFKIGNNLKGALVVIDQETGKAGIELTNKYSNEFYGTISTFFDNEVIVDFDIRDTDDSVLVITDPAGQSSETVGVLTPTGGGTAQVVRTDRVFDPFNVYHVDADLVDDFKLGLNQAPKIMRRYESESLFYKSSNITTSIRFSENDSNMFIFQDFGSATTRFISNPQYPAGFLSTANLQFLPNSYFGFIEERFGDSRTAYNSNGLPSNFFNYINFLMEENGGNVFYLLQNTGRLYLSKSTKLIYDNILPLDLPHTYDRELGCESSLGISLNSEIESILKDTLKIYVNLALVVTGNSIEGVPILGRYTSYPNINLDFRDFEFHENEEINYNVVSRVFDSLYNLQKNVLDSILNN